MLERRVVEGEARSILDQLGIAKQPVNPTLVAEALGLDVRAVLFRDPEMHGRVTKNADRTVIEVAALDAASRRRFTVAHEIGHALLHLKDVPNGSYTDSRTQLFRLANVTPLSDPAETNANQFAAALLMPDEWVRLAHQRTRNVADLAREFNVSVDAMTFRIKNLGLV